MSPFVPITAGLSLFGISTWIFGMQDEPELEVIEEKILNGDLDKRGKYDLKVQGASVLARIYHTLTNKELYRDMTDLRIFRQEGLTVKDFKINAEKPIVATYPCLNHDIYQLKGMTYEKLTLAAPTSSGPVYLELWAYREMYRATYVTDRLRLTVPDDLLDVCPFHEWKDEKYTKANILKMINWVREAELLSEMMNS